MIRGRVRHVGRYAIHERIASGGMAAVHVGRMRGDAGFARTVAIKLLHPDAARDAELVRMLVDEARVVARIHHPNVVPTLDVVENEGEVLLVMEYVDGVSIAAIARELRDAVRRVPPEIVAAIMSNVLHGLHAAHQARDEKGVPLDVIHRDVSPQNVIVGRDGVARVVDFGVAKAIGRFATTRDGYLKGKLGYMAPEQLHGQSIDRRVDLFAASVVFWELLTGKLLLIGDTEGETVNNVLAREITPPSAHGAPGVFDSIVLRGLARNPVDRYATARAMALDLERVFDPAPPSVVGSWLEGVAGAILDEHSRIVEEAERDEVPHAPSAPVAVAADPTLRSARVARRAPLLALAGASVLALAALMVVVPTVGRAWRASTSVKSDESPAGEPAASASVVAAAVVTVPVAPAGSLSATVATATAATKPSGVLQRFTTKPGCDPPFVRDEHGRKIYKRACL